MNVLMPAGREHHKSKKSRYQVVLIPQDDAGSTRSFIVSIPMISGIVSFAVVFVVGLTVAAIIYTPAGRILPTSEAELERKYGTELVLLNHKLSTISEEVIVLREYNHKLRSALGEDVQKDSVPGDVQFTDKPITQERINVPVEDDPTPIAPQQIQNSGSMAPVHVVSAAAFQASFPITAPVEGYVSRKFESEEGHIGIDYAGKIGAVISSAADGYVVFAGWTYDDGNMVIISHGGGYVSIYKHNQSLLKFAGDFVKRGEPLALLGNSGRTSYGPHLHFELWRDGQPQNPEQYLIASEL